MSWCSDHGLPHSALLEWDDLDRAKLHALLLEESTRCAMCGTQPWEWEADRNAYYPVKKHCVGCYRKKIAADDEDSLEGTTIELVPRSQYDPAQDAKTYAQKKRRRVGVD